MPPKAAFQTTSAIAEELERFLGRSRPAGFTIAGGSLPPPALSFMVPFPRMSLTLRGSDEMEIELDRRHAIISPKRGEAVFVPGNAWNRPTWSRPVKVLHFLFGPRNVGISLVEHDGHAPEPGQVRKTSLPAGGGVTREILNALAFLTAEPSSEKMGALLVEALLLSLSRTLQTPERLKARKGRNTYEKICLYLQEHFHQPITRESVANQFNLNPNHLSRLFRREGLMRFTDYLAWVRMDRAKYLLTHHDLMLDDLARRCGYQDTAYFCRVFKQRTNRTPGRYQIESRQSASATARKRIR